MNQRQRQELAGRFLRMQADGDRRGMEALRSAVGEDAMGEVARECQAEIQRRANRRRERSS